MDTYGCRDAPSVTCYYLSRRYRVHGLHTVPAHERDRERWRYWYAPFKSEVLRVTFAALAFWPMTVLLSHSTLLMVYTSSSVGLV